MVDTFYAMDYSAIASYLGISLVAVTVLIAIVMIWSIIWKGLALWKSAKKNHKIWFIILLVVNTVGILEILYIYVFSKMKLGKSNPNPRTSKKKKKR